MVNGIDGAIGASALWRDSRLEEGNVKQSLVLGKGYKKENANRQYLRCAKVCCVVHLLSLACSRLGCLEWGVGEKRREPGTGCLS